MIATVMLVVTIYVTLVDNFKARAWEKPYERK